VNNAEYLASRCHKIELKWLPLLLFWTTGATFGGSSATEGNWTLWGVLTFQCTTLWSINPIKFLRRPRPSSKPWGCGLVCRFVEAAFVRHGVHAEMNENNAVPLARIFSFRLVKTVRKLQCCVRFIVEKIWIETINLDVLELKSHGCLTVKLRRVA